MKAFILAVILLIALPITSSATYRNIGDINEDSTINIVDAENLLDIIDGTQTNATSAQKKLADIDRNGKVSLADAMTLYQFSRGTKKVLGPDRFIYLSPSNQVDNPYSSTSPTNECFQMERVGAVVARELSKFGVRNGTAERGTSILQRGLNANTLKSYAYVAIHSNAANRNATGTEIFHYPATTFDFKPSLNKPPIAGRPESRKLASSIYDVLAPATVLSPSDRGLKNGFWWDDGSSFVEIRTPNMANCLIETEFHDVQATANWIIDNVETIGKAIADGILRYVGTQINV